MCMNGSTCCSIQSFCLQSWDPQRHTVIFQTFYRESNLLYMSIIFQTFYFSHMLFIMTSARSKMFLLVLTSLLCPPCIVESCSIGAPLSSSSYFSLVIVLWIMRVQGRTCTYIFFMVSNSLSTYHIQRMSEFYLLFIFISCKTMSQCFMLPITLIRMPFLSSFRFSF